MNIKHLISKNKRNYQFYFNKINFVLFNRSYLVTSTDIEIDRLREEQERKQDAEAEQELVQQKIQRRQPLADLSKKSTGKNTLLY